MYRNGATMQMGASTDTLSSLGYDSNRSDSPPASVSCGGSQGHLTPPRPAGTQQQLGPMRKGHSPRNDAGDVMVLTPWFGDGLPKQGIMLSQEIDAFYKFLSLTTEERSARDAAIGDIRQWVHRSFPSAVVEAYGSYAYGTSLPSSDVDVMAQQCGDLSSLRTPTFPLPPGYTGGRVVVNSPAADGAFVQINCPGGVTVNLSLVAKESQALVAVEMCRGLMKQFPAAGPVATAFRHILGQVKAADVRSGGLSSYCVLLMVAYVCRRVSNPADAGEVFVGFLQEFGSFRFDLLAVSPVLPAPVPKAPQLAAEPIVVLDPLMPGNNLARGCTRLRHIVGQFQYCLMAVRRWGGSQSGPQEWKGYKGRTPLSALISHQPLWARTDYLNSLKAARNQAIPVADIIVDELEADDQPPPLAASPLSTPAATPLLNPQFEDPGALEAIFLP
eukprot:Hpha_TRINITY_DN14273_c0_g1::TRINITY_DN14273_c0_g1_i1::g.22163::m.22163/K03514/PAPD5_7, TRF4; non-canonical poly(A) RNA polymerase PAPD5/7